MLLLNVWFTFLALAGILVVQGGSLLRAPRTRNNLLCHVTLELVSTSEVDSRQNQHYECSPIENGLVSDYSYTVEFPTEFTETNQDELLSGTLFASIPMGKIVNSTVVYPNDSEITVGAAPSSFTSRRRRLSSSGTRSILVLRICANDASPTLTAQQYYKYIFAETSNSQPTLKSQYKQMSFGKLNIIPTKYGVMDVKVNMNANGASSMAVRDAAIAAVTSKYRLSSITEMADHVMLCIPPGTGDWAGSSPVSSWRMVLNNQWCGYISGLVHEMGHNLGLLHSNVGGVPYMDFTSYMSAGYTTTYWPAKSFNGANNWQFGWYSDRQVTIDPAQGGKVVTLATFVDYGKKNKNYPVLIKVGSCVFLQYNRAKSFNFQTQQNIDQVTIVQQLSNGTNLLGGIDTSHPQLRIASFCGSGRTVVINACSRGVGSINDPDWMSISIGYDRNYCSQSSKSIPVQNYFTPARPPTKPPSKPTAPTKPPSKPTAPKPITSSCQDKVSAFSTDRGQKTCSWLRIRPVWQKKLCLNQNVRIACPKTCGVC